MKVLSVVGARPQFVKAAPVTRALAAADISEYLVHTGQHYDSQMSDVFFSELGIRPPDLNLSIGSGSHATQTGMMLQGLEKAIIAQTPDWVLVYGDTNSTLAGTLAAAKLHVPVVHVESGLRSFNRRMPEEINRIVSDVLSSILFIPTEAARHNLIREGVPSTRVVWTGDVMLDASLLFRDRAKRESAVNARLGLQEKAYILATIHRAENTDDPVRLQCILAALQMVAEHTRVILPLHPRTRARLEESRGPAAPRSRGPFGRLEVIEPVGFLDMLRLEASAQVIATDSGGVQKEAFFHGVPCVTLRDETEWIELVELGWNRLVSPLQTESISQAILSARGSCGKTAMPYGDGHASDRIAKSLLSLGSN